MRPADGGVTGRGLGAILAERQICSRAHAVRDVVLKYAVIGAVGGATVVGLFKAAAFDSYCVGLAIGFFAYFITGVGIAKWGKPSGTAPAGDWMETRDSQ